MPSSDPPCNIKIFKGYKNGALTWSFVKFATENLFALEFYHWLYDTRCPEEHFLPTLFTLSTFQEKDVDADDAVANHTMTVFQRLEDADKQEKEGPRTWERITG